MIRGGKLIWLSALVCLSTPVAQAETAPTFRLSLPRQPLPRSLETVASVTRTNVIFTPAAAKGRVAPALKGSYSVSAALRRLLQGTGLSVSITAGGSYVISNPSGEWTPPGSVVDTDAPMAAVEEGAPIVVTGSRIDTPGFEAPTPTLHMTKQSLDIGARPNVAAALNDLPQFRGTISPQNTGTNTSAGQAPVDLRGLGISRTLVLLDGRRFSSENDLNAIPTVLIKSVDIVTGGASAAWGSGAVAGVVNIVLDEDFTGLKLGAQAGISSYKDAAEHRFEAAFGTPFADGRGHFVIGGEYLDNEGVIPKVSRPNVGRWATIANGGGTFTLTPDVGFSNAAYGGIILSGVLSGKGFNPDGSLRPINYGVVSGTNMIGGEGPSNDDLSPLVTPQRRYAMMAKASYELNDTLMVTTEFRHSRMWNDYIWFGDNNRGNLTIKSDNAFLRPEIRAQLATAGQTSFTMGRFNSDLSYPTIDYARKNTQGTLAIDGKSGNGRWRYGAYYSHGQFDNNMDSPGFLLTTPYAQAVDSIISPTTGQPICRIALTNPSTNCVPINLFGLGAPSQAAIDYVTGTPTSRSRTRLDTAGVSLRGEPFDLWAGPISIAVGGEWRKESINARVGALDLAKAFTTFNFSPLRGSFTVKEAFAEILLPLVRGLPVLNKLEFNGAARISDYNTTGSIWSWKLGLTNEFFPGMKGRVTRSRDIRSANLAELYTQSTTGYNTLTDPVTNTSVYVLNNGGGNPALEPEIANSLTAGFHYAPPALPGFNLSLDYYRIHIDNVITTIPAQDLVVRCFNGNQALCAKVERDADGNITRTVSPFLNLAQYRTDGIDAELWHRLPLSQISNLPGRLDFRVLGTWVHSLTANDGVSTIEYAGSQGNSFSFGVPRWRINASIGYDDEGSGLLVRSRYISSGNYNSTVKLLNNHIPAYIYVDLQARARIETGSGTTMEVHADVTNLFDRQPPVGSLYSPFYDVIGRYLSVGAKLEF
jgi:iron complex outermembrane receptor protein